MQKSFPNGTVACNSIKRLLRDLSPFRAVDFILDADEISKLNKYSAYRKAYESYRLSGNAPDSFGVIVGISGEYEQFFILPKDLCERIAIVLNKKLTELTSEERAFLMDDSKNELLEVQ